MDTVKILQRLNRAENFANAILEETAVVRRELEIGLSSSPERGKSKKNQEAINTVLRNRAIQTGKKLNK